MDIAHTVNIGAYFHVASKRDFNLIPLCPSWPVDQILSPAENVLEIRKGLSIGLAVKMGGRGFFGFSLPVR